jgi:hypothetical protein
MKMLYGEEASLDVEPDAEGGFVARVRIPVDGDPETTGDQRAAEVAP